MMQLVTFTTSFDFKGRDDILTVFFIGLTRAFDKAVSNGHQMMN